MLMIVRFAIFFKEKKGQNFPCKMQRGPYYSTKRSNERNGEISQSCVDHRSMHLQPKQYQFTGKKLNS